MADEKKVDTTIKGQMNSLSEEAREFSNDMSKRLHDEVKLKDIENEHREKIIEDLQNEGKIKDPANLTKEENLLVVRGLNKIRNTKVLESVKKIAKEFFDKEQGNINDMQARYDELKKAADIEAKKVQEELKVLQDKQRAHEEDNNNPDLTEEEKKELRELIKKNRYFEEKYPKKLSVMNQRISAARDTIELQKKLLNAECQDRFGGWAVNNKAPNKSQEKDGTIGNNEEANTPRQNNGDEKRDKKEDEPIIGNGQGKVQGQGGPQQGGTVTYGGGQGMQQHSPNAQVQGVSGAQSQQGTPVRAQQQGAPTAPGNNSGQINTPTNPSEQQPEQSETQEHIPTDEELLGEESPILKFNGEKMTPKEALEIIRKYSEFSPEDRRTCLRNNGLEVVDKAYETLRNDRGENLSKQEKELFVEYSRTISKATKDMAKLVENNSLKPSGRNPLSFILNMDRKSKEFKEIHKYFKHGIRKNKPLVIYDYQHMPQEMRKLLDKVLKEKEIEFGKIADDTIELTTEDGKPIDYNKKENMERLINTKLAKDKDNADMEDVERTFGDLIRAGKALGFSKEIEKIAMDIRDNKYVQNTGREDNKFESEDRTLFEDDLAGKVNTPEDMADKKLKSREERVNEELRKDAHKLEEEINEKIKNAVDVTLEEVSKYNQYCKYGVLDDSEIEFEREDIISSEVKEFFHSDVVKNVLEKFDKLKKAIEDESISEDMLLTASELDMIVYGGELEPSSKELEKYVSEKTLQEYREKYDLKYQAEKKVEKEELEKEQEQPEEDREAHSTEDEDPVI